MRKVTQRITEAWAQGRKLTVSNTRTDGTSIWLFDHEIVRIVDDDIMFTFAGYGTPTTRDRLNAVLNQHGISLYQRKGEQMATVSRFNGADATMTLDDDVWYSVCELRGVTRKEPEPEPVDDWELLEA